MGLQSFDSEYRSAGETPPGGARFMMWGVKRISVISFSGMYVTELFPGVHVI